MSSFKSPRLAVRTDETGRFGKEAFLKRAVGYNSLLLFLVTILSNCAQPDGFPHLQGPYFGQKPPGSTPEVFAPGIVCTGLYERDVAFSPDGNEFYFGIVTGDNAYSAILVSIQAEGRWTRPEVAPFSGNPKYRDLEHCISPDGKRLYFVSNRPDPLRGETEGDWDIWVMERGASGWEEPINLGPPVNTDSGEYFPSVSRNGTLYFTRDDPKTRIHFIYRARLVDGKYSEPEKLPPQVNCGQSQFNAFIAADESYMIVPVFGREDSCGSTDYYIVFRNKKDEWSDPINMGEKINTPSGFEWSPYVSPDGKYFFFMSTRPRSEREIQEKFWTFERLKWFHNLPQNGNPDIYWVDAKIIEDLKPKELK